MKVIIESLSQYDGLGHAVVSGSQVPNETSRVKGAIHPTASIPQLLVFSANSQVSLKSQIDGYKTYTREHPEAIPDIAYTLAAHREKLPQRAFAICKNGEIETSGLVKAPASPPTITMVFSGQGSQWPEMGKQLILTNARFRHDLATMDSILQTLKKAPSWSILGT